MTESVDRQTAVLRLRGADDILILCHKNPDGDTIGCAGALPSLGPDGDCSRAARRSPTKDPCGLPWKCSKDS